MEPVSETTPAGPFGPLGNGPGSIIGSLPSAATTPPLAEIGPEAKLLIGKRPLALELPEAFHSETLASVETFSVAVVARATEVANRVPPINARIVLARSICFIFSY